MNIVTKGMSASQLLCTKGYGGVFYEGEEIEMESPIALSRDFKSRVDSSGISMDSPLALGLRVQSRVEIQ